MAIGLETRQTCQSKEPENREVLLDSGETRHAVLASVGLQGSMQKVHWRLKKEIAHRVQFTHQRTGLDVLAGDTFVRECEGPRVKLEASVASALFTWPDIFF
jgi:hypothetical protein